MWWKGQGAVGGSGEGFKPENDTFVWKVWICFLHFDVYLYWLIWFSKLYSIILMLSYSQTDQANNASNSYKVFPCPVLPFNDTTLCGALHTGLQI